MPKRLGIVSGGGDCPGLNAVIDAIVKALDQEYEILGFYRGFEGILSKDYIFMDQELTNPYQFAGGTILKSVNKGNFAGKVGKGQVNFIDSEIVKQTVANYEELNLEGLIVLGGDGTLTSAHQLSLAGLNIIAIPKSIDNDLMGTDFTLGFLSAVDVAAKSLDRLATTAFSHDRVMILEVMGRNAGWISLYSGISGGADMILIPEIKYTLENIKKFVDYRNANNAPDVLIVVSEGASPEDDQKIYKQSNDKSSEKLLGGVGQSIATYLNQFENIDARCTTLGHLQRGGSPVVMDRILARSFGSKSAELFKTGRFGTMVTYRGGLVGHKKIEDCVRDLKLVSPDHPLINSAKNLEIEFGDDSDFEAKA